MATVATLTIDLVAKSAKLRSELTKAGKYTKNWGKKTRSEVNAVGKMMAGVAAAGVTAIAASYVVAAKEADKLAKTADKLGILPEKLTAIGYAGELTGVSIETTNMALQRMTRRVAEAGQGTGEAVKALAELNLNAKDLAKLSPDQQFSVLADAMNNVGDSGDRVRLAMKLFDSEGVSLVNTLALGSGGLAEMEQEANELGITLTRFDLAKIEAANDSFLKVQKTNSAFGKSLATELAPLVEAISDRFVDAAKEAGGFGSVAKSVVSSLVTGVGFLGNTIRGMEVIWASVKVAVIGYAAATLEAWAGVDRVATNVLNKIPGVTAETSKGLQNLASEMTADLGTAVEDLNKLMMLEMPLDQARKAVAAINLVANANAKAAALSKENTGGGNIDVGVAVADTSGAFERVRQSLLSEENAVNESYNRRRQIILDNTLETDTQQADLLRQLKEARDADLEEIKQTKYEEDNEQAIKAAEEWVAIWDDAANRFSAGIGNAVANAVFEQKNLGDAAKSIVVDMGKQILSTLVEIGVKKMIMAAMGKSILANETAAAVVAGKTVALGWSQAAAMTSLASFGGNAIPAAAAITNTSALATGLAGVMHDGGAVPTDGTYFLQKGEFVQSKDNVDKGSSEKLSVVINNAPAGNHSVSQDERGITIDLAVDKMIDEMNGGRVGDAMESRYGINSAYGARR